ncbi:unnamed protein product [Porites evermanni]|uniref:Uncharacterized protein n=1 Tax=Porites evermanni TaxID=104178 RepID=A0ABN8SA63_9CNID|nr:unnamed protein product [Porites evermanni]
MSINLCSRIKVFKKVKNCSDSQDALMLSFVGGSDIVISEVVDRDQFFALKIRAIPSSENQAQSVRSGERPGSVKAFKHWKNLESVGKTMQAKELSLRIKSQGSHGSANSKQR